MPLLGVSRVLSYRPEQLFELAADIERYPEFLPWWLSATIRRRDGEEVYYTDQVVGLGPVTQRFSSKTVLRRPDEIEVTSIDGSFETFELLWRFNALPQGRCEVSLTGEIELHTKLLRGVLGGVTTRGAGAILAAFEARAESLFGPLPG